MQDDIAQSIIAMVQDRGKMTVVEGVDVIVAPGLFVTHLSIALACARFVRCLGPDNTRDGRTAYGYVAGVMAGHHVTTDPRELGV